MRILIDNGEYAMINRGDVAMLVVTVDRLRERWPDAWIGVVTTAPLRLRLLCPQAEPVAFPAGRLWPVAISRAARRVPSGVLRAAVEAGDSATRLRGKIAWRLERALRLRLPGGRRGGVGEATGGAGAPADLVVALGGGYMTDVDARQACRVMATLAAAQARAVPTVMLSQGLGPLDDPALRRGARSVLPDVDLIALRESVVGPRLLAEFGVPGDRVVVTGDDAVELGYRLRRPDLGGGLGVSARHAHYAQVGEDDLGLIRTAVHGLAAAHGAPLVPLAVCDPEDRDATEALVAGAPLVIPDAWRFATAEDTVRRVGLCRVVVTATYHLAVFALSQGIPAVCLPRTPYYVDKFVGLRELFGPACEVVALDTADREPALRASLGRAWASAESVRPALLEAAERQIAAGRDAMDRVAEMVGERGRAVSAAEPLRPRSPE